MKTYSTVNQQSDILKSVAPFLVAFPSFDFIYRGGSMTNLILNTDLPKNSISLITDGTLMVRREYTTAFVGFHPETGKNIEFQFNKYFAETLDDIERSFVFAHEALHVLLDHGKAGKVFLESLPEDKRSYKILNVAMDVCINEILIRECFADHAPYMNILENMCLIETVFTKKGIVVEPEKDFEYYYHKIFDNLTEDELSQMTMFGDQEYYKDLPDWAKDVLEDIAEKSGFDGSSNAAADKLKSRGGQGSGSAKFEPVVTQFKKMNVEDAIARYIKPRNMSAIDMRAPSKSSYKWYGMDRRNIAVVKNMPNVNIPIRQTAYKNKKMRVVVYCDVSGSVANYTKKFLSIIDLIENERSEVLTYVWADSVGEAKRAGSDKYKWNGVGGGTNIKSVFSHFYANYPEDNVDAVVVLTDGEYDNIEKYKLKGKFDHTKWKFFMTSNTRVKNVIEKSVSVEIDWDHYGRDL